MEPTLISGESLLKLLFDFIMAAGLAFIMLPSIRAVSRRWSLYDFDVSQEITLSHIPRHGGIALIVAFGISIAVFSPENMMPGVKFVLAALLLLLAAGLQDDLLHLSWFFRIMVVVGTAAIITDVAGMPLFRTGFGVIYDYPLPDLLVTYSIYTGCVVLMIASSRIPGMVSMILLFSAANLALIFLRSGFPELALIPIALAGASLVLFISSALKYVFEGRASALAGGFMLAMLIIFTHNISGQLSIGVASILGGGIMLLMVPMLIMLKLLTWEDHILLIKGKRINLLIAQVTLMILLSLLLIIFNK